MGVVPQRQRVAAYAVIVRDDQILLCRLAERVTKDELWTLPGGGLDHGEDPRAAVLREIHEETGLTAEVGERPRVYSAHQPSLWREGGRYDYHALRIVYDGWVPPGSPAPRVVEVDGSTAEAAWVPLVDVYSGAVPVVAMVTEALADHEPAELQRLAAYALVRRGDTVLLTRSRRWATTAGPGRCPAAGSATVSHRRPRWPASWPRSAGCPARSATCSTSTTSTSPAWLRPVGWRTSTGST